MHSAEATDNSRLIGAVQDVIHLQALHACHLTAHLNNTLQGAHQLHDDRVGQLPLGLNWTLAPETQVLHADAQLIDLNERKRASVDCPVAVLSI